MEGTAATQNRTTVFLYPHFLQAYVRMWFALTSQAPNSNGEQRQVSAWLDDSNKSIYRCGFETLWLCRTNSPILNLTELFHRTVQNWQPNPNPGALRLPQSQNGSCQWLLRWRGLLALSPDKGGRSTMGTLGCQQIKKLHVRTWGLLLTNSSPLLQYTSSPFPPHAQLALVYLWSSARAEAHEHALLDICDTQPSEEPAI